MAKVRSVALNDDDEEKLGHLAASLGRPKAWLIEQAITRYVDEQTWQIVAIEEALAEYQSGTATLIPHAEVEARMEEPVASSGAALTWGSANLDFGPSVPRSMA